MRRDLKAAACELATYIDRHPAETPLLSRLIALTAGGCSARDYFILERCVRRLLRRRAS